MSLFISSLAAEQVGTGMIVDNRLGILGGSVLSAVIGYLMLAYSLGRANAMDSPSSHSGKPE